MRAGSNERIGRIGRIHLARGFTYLLLLAAVVSMGVALAALGPLWADEVQRERERDLLRVGEAYARAIATYYHAAPAAAKRYPRRLDDLLQDTRQPLIRRHMRRAYADPMNPQRAWGLVLAGDGGIAGVFSQDVRQPWRREAIVTRILELPADAAHYSDWIFAPKQP